jgi:AcrR family transcriptional regulator
MTEDRPERKGGLRADAVRNRRAIIATAHEVYGQRGLEAPLDDIARDAGVGNATVYRHFPSRCALVAAVFADTLRRVVEAAERALGQPDPWEGFAGHVRFLCGLQAQDRGMADLLTTQVTGAPELEEVRKRAYETFVQLADRAKVTGVLRADFTPEDLVLLLMANAGLVHRTAEDAPTAWQRFVDIQLDGLRAESATPSIAGPVAEEVEAAMRRRGRDLGYCAPATVHRPCPPRL